MPMVQPIESVDQALAELTRRYEACELDGGESLLGDTVRGLGDRVLAEHVTNVLLRSDGDETWDVGTLTVLGAVHLVRSQHTDHWRDIVLALALLGPVRRGAPELLAEPAHEYLVEGPGAEYTSPAGRANLAGLLLLQAVRDDDLGLGAACLLQYDGLFGDLDAEHPHSAEWHSLYSLALQHWFEQTGEDTALLAGIGVQDIALERTSRTDPQWQERLVDLVRLMLKYADAVDDGILDAAFELCAEADEAGIPAATMLVQFGALRLRHALSTADMDRLPAAIRAFETALACTSLPEASRLVATDKLGMTLRIMAEHLDDDELLDRAEEAARACVELMPEDHPDLPPALANLAMVLLRRRDDRSCEKAFTLARTAVQRLLPDDEHTAHCHDVLGLTLLQRFERDDDLDLLAAAVASWRTSVATASFPEAWAATNAQLVDALTTLGSRTPANEEAISLLDEAVRRARDGVARWETGPASVSARAALATALTRLFERTEQVGLIDEAIEILHAIADELPDSHPDQIVSLLNIGAVLSTKGQALCDVPLLRAALGHFAAGVTASVLTASDAELEKLYTNVVQTMSEIGELAGAEEAERIAVSVIDDVDNAVPVGTPYRGVRMVELGLALRLRRTDTTQE